MVVILHKNKIQQVLTTIMCLFKEYVKSMLVSELHNTLLKCSILKGTTINNQVNTLTTSYLIRCSVRVHGVSLFNLVVPIF